MECLDKQGVLAGIKVDEVRMQMLNIVFVQPGLAFYLHKQCISIATPHSSICTKCPVCSVINLQHLLFVAGQQCSFLQHDNGLTGALSRRVSTSSSFAAIAELYVEKLYVVTRRSFFSSTYYAGLTLFFSIRKKACRTLHILGNGFVTSYLFAFQGLMPFEGHEGETVTRGLEHLEANCQQYYRYPCSHHFVIA